jgi:peptidyl-prolyl cis-trans isomerase C
LKQKTIVYHILVDHKYQAEDLLKTTRDATTFELAAAKYSKCSSAKQGGWLGEFQPQRFVEAFSEAVEELPFDQISEPVRSQFGYHLILKKLK